MAGGTWSLGAISLTANTTSAKSTPLLPPNTRKNSFPVVSPDGGMVAFASAQGPAVSLYTLALGHAGAEPTLVVAKLTFGLIDWQ
jgi:hypothetical protein